MPHTALGWASGAGSATLAANTVSGDDVPNLVKRELERLDLLPVPKRLRISEDGGYITLFSNGPASHEIKFKDEKRGEAGTALTLTEDGIVQFSKFAGKEEFDLKVAGLESSARTLVEQLESSTAALQSSTNLLQNSSLELQSETKELQTEVKDLSAQSSALTTGLQNVQATIGNWNFSESYTEPGGTVVTQLKPIAEVANAISSVIGDWSYQRQEVKTVPNPDDPLNPTQDVKVTVTKTIAEILTEVDGQLRYLNSRLAPGDEEGSGAGDFFEALYGTVEEISEAGNTVVTMGAAALAKTALGVATSAAAAGLVTAATAGSALEKSNTALDRLEDAENKLDTTALTVSDLSSAVGDWSSTEEGTISVVELKVVDADGKETTVLTNVVQPVTLSQAVRSLREQPSFATAEDLKTLDTDLKSLETGLADEIRDRYAQDIQQYDELRAVDERVTDLIEGQISVLWDARPNPNDPYTTRSYVSNQLTNYATNSNLTTNYVTHTSAEATYLTKFSADAKFLTKTEASSTYLTQADADIKYAGGTSLSNYYTKSETYTKSEADLNFASKAQFSQLQASHVISGEEIARNTTMIDGLNANFTSYTPTVYTKDETHTNFYTKSELDNQCVSGVGKLSFESLSLVDGTTNTTKVDYWVDRQTTIMTIDWCGVVLPNTLKYVRSFWLRLETHPTQDGLEFLPRQNRMYNTTPENAWQDGSAFWTKELYFPISIGYNTTNVGIHQQVQFQCNLYFTGQLRVVDGYNEYELQLRRNDRGGLGYAAGPTYLVMPATTLTWRNRRA